MDKTIEEFDFENRIIKTSDILEDENFDQWRLPRGIAELPFSEELKKKLISYVDNIRIKGLHGGCVLIGCPDSILTEIVSAIDCELLELELLSKVIDFKTMVFEKEGDFAPALTNISFSEIAVFKNIQYLKPQLTRMLYSAVANNTINITIGKGPAARHIDIDLGIDFFIIIADHRKDIPVECYERVYTVIDFTDFKEEIRRATAITTFAKYNLTATEEALNQLSQLNISEQDFTMRLVDIRNKAYEANVTEITESLLLGSKKSLPGIEVVNQMEGREFELFTGDLFRALGYINVNVTPDSGDFGADVIAEKDDVKFAIQCKRYSAPVGVSAVQEVLASKSLHDCHVACILTNNAFTPAAEALAKKNLVILWGGDKLQEFINRAKA